MAALVIMETPWAAERQARRSEEARTLELRGLREHCAAMRWALKRFEARIARLEAEDRVTDVTRLAPPVQRFRRRKTELTPAGLLLLALSLGARVAARKGAGASTHWGDPVAPGDEGG